MPGGGKSPCKGPKGQRVQCDGLFDHGEGEHGQLAGLEIQHITRGLK